MFLFKIINNDYAVKDLNYLERFILEVLQSIALTLTEYQTLNNYQNFKTFLRNIPFIHHILPYTKQAY